MTMETFFACFTLDILTPESCPELWADDFRQRRNMNKAHGRLKEIKRYEFIFAAEARYHAIQENMKRQQMKKKS